MATAEPQDMGRKRETAATSAFPDKNAIEFTETDSELATALMPDVTIAVVHAQLDAVACTARQQKSSITVLNVLRSHVHRALRCAPDAALLAQRVCRIARNILHSEEAAFFRFDQDSSTLWVSAVASRSNLSSASLVVDPRSVRGIASAVALSGKPQSFDSVRGERAWNPALDAPMGMKLDNVLSVPLLVKHKNRATVVGVVQVMNRRTPQADHAPDCPWVHAVARSLAGIELRASEHASSAKKESAEARSWNEKILVMIAEETVSALGELESRQRDNEDGEPAEPRSPLLDALCAAERRFVAAEDRVALMRAARESLRPD